MKTRTSRKREREYLEHEIRGEEFQRMLLSLQGREAFLKQFEAWQDVIEFVRKGNLREPRKDDVLRPLLRERTKNIDHRLNVILLLVFWSELEALYWRKCGWDKDHEERWQTLICVFYEVIHRLDLNKRPSCLAQKIINDTSHRFHDEYCRRWRRMKREKLIADQKLHTVVDCDAGIDFTALELREAREMETSRLRKHMEAGRINGDEFAMLVSTRIHGQSLANFARETGLTYDGVKKRRQRAEARIRLHEKK